MCGADAGMAGCVGPRQAGADMLLLLAEDAKLKQAKDCLVRCSQALPTLRANVEQAHSLFAFRTPATWPASCLSSPPLSRLPDASPNASSAFPTPSSRCAQRAVKSGNVGLGQLAGSDSSARACWHTRPEHGGQN